MKLAPGAPAKFAVTGREVLAYSCAQPSRSCSASFSRQPASTAPASSAPSTLPAELVVCGATLRLSCCSFAANAVRLQLHALAYFRKVSDDRRRRPTDDLATVIANGEIDGRPIEDCEAMGYYITVAFAGHDTTSSSVSGALWALSERPDQLQRVRSDPSLIPSLVEEAIRWTTPIHQFVRVAAQDHEIRGRKVLRGDKVILCFPSGNRDEEVFADPFEFRVDRTPNRQIGFGYGAHMCLGMHLARMEMSIFFQELLPRLERVELAGKPRRTITNFVGGPKSVPIRFSMRH